MATSGAPGKGGEDPVDGATTADVPSEAQPSTIKPVATSSPSCNFVTIRSLSEACDRDDIDKALRQKTNDVADVKIHHLSHPNSQDVIHCATASLGASTEIFDINVHEGFPNHTVETLFNEDCVAAFTLDQSLFTEHIVQCVVRQATKLQIAIGFNTQFCQVKISGRCKQVHTFREYLAALTVQQVYLNPELTTLPVHPHVNTAAPLGQPEATGLDTSTTPSSSEGDLNTGNSFANFSPDVLVLMPKLKDIPGLKYFPEEGRVEVTDVSPEEREKVISKFQETYQQIVTNRQLKTGSMELPPSSKPEEIIKLLTAFNEKYHQCHFSYNSTSHSVRIVSISTRQFEQAKKLLKDRIAGKPSSMVNQPNESDSSEVLILPHGRIVTVKRGNIVEEVADVLVNAANSQLKHYAGVAGALDKASDGNLQKHSDQYTRIHGDVPAGEVAITQAGGRLRCRHVIHAVGPIAGMHKSEVLCQQLIFDAITKTLKKAQSVKSVSIVLPALSTGVYAVDPKLSAQAMLNAIHDFKYPKDLLKDIRIVILDEPTYSCFAKELLHFGALHKGNETKESAVVPRLERSLSDPNSTNNPAEGRFSTKEFQPETSKGSTPGYNSTADGVGVVTIQPMSTQPTTDLPWVSYPDMSSSLIPISAHAACSGPPGLVTSISHSGHTSQPSTTWGSGYTTRPVSTPAIMSAGTPGGGLPPVGGDGASNMSKMSSTGGLLRPATFQGDSSKGLLLPNQVGFKNPSSSDPGKKPGLSTGSNPDPSKSDLSHNGCPICLSDVATNPTHTPCCKQVFCTPCLDKALQYSPYCPTCKKPLRTVQGPQPPGGKMSHHNSYSHLPGYPSCNTIVIKYVIPNGIQGPQHPKPGQRYTGTSRTAYLPDNKEGRRVLELLRRAFDAGLTFTVGTSTTTGASNTVVWNDVHHKTSTSGGTTCYGYPDDTYLKRVKEELKAKGIY